MDYSKLSDFEINRAVGEVILKGRWACNPGTDANNTDSWHYGSVDQFVTPYPELPDYCNNAAEAWQIIVGSRISLSPFDDFKEGGDYIAAKYKPTRDNSKPAEVEFFCCDKPLRAAMIVYLMMQDGDQ